MGEIYKRNYKILTGIRTPPLEEPKDLATIEAVQSGIAQAPSGGGGGGYAICFGGNFNSSPPSRYARANGNAVASILTTPTPPAGTAAVATIPVTGTITAVGWATQIVASQVMRIVVNGTPSGTFTILSLTGVATLSVAVAAGDEVAIEYFSTSGGNPNQTAIQVYIAT